jgi:ABC-type uncharacterized transport system substrate-binding protein
VPLRFWRLLCLACWLFGAGLPAWGKGPVLWVALSGGDAPEAEAVEALRRGLAEHELVVRPWREFIGRAAPPPRLLVTLGGEATRRVAEPGDPAWPRVPVVALLVSRAVLEGMPARAERPLTGVWLDQPFDRQLALLRLAAPGLDRLAVLLGPTSRRYQAELQQAARNAGYKLAAEVLADPDRLAAALQETLADGEALLSVPDPAVYNSDTAQNILRSAYRQRTPVVGYSAAFVRAGALLAVYSSPAQAGQQAAEIATRVLAGGLPPAQAPRDFRVAVNAGVGRSLGIALDEDDLERQLRQTAAMHGQDRRAP